MQFYAGGGGEGGERECVSHLDWCSVSLNTCRIFKGGGANPLLPLSPTFVCRVETNNVRKSISNLFGYFENLSEFSIKIEEKYRFCERHIFTNFTRNVLSNPPTTVKEMKTDMLKNKVFFG